MFLGLLAMPIVAVVGAFRGADAGEVDRAVDTLTRAFSKSDFMADLRNATVEAGRNADATRSFVPLGEAGAPPDNGGLRASAVAAGVDTILEITGLSLR